MVKTGANQTGNLQVMSVVTLLLSAYTVAKFMSVLQICGNETNHHKICGNET